MIARPRLHWCLRMTKDWFSPTRGRVGEHLFCVSSPAVTEGNAMEVDPLATIASIPFYGSGGRDRDPDVGRWCWPSRPRN